MSTGLIIVLIVVAVLIIGAVVARFVMARGAGGGRGLKRRFGPEYDRAVARHDGDSRAAERELDERVKRHGSLRARPLQPAEREAYSARWTAVQERFVDEPREAVIEADRLLGELAGARGFPDSGHYDEQLAALSVHHPHHVHGYRRIHRAAHAPTTAADATAAGTEELREALVEARALFEDLTAPGREDRAMARRTDTEEAPANARADGSRGRLHSPLAFNRRHHAKGS
ncbi:hypothetical protein [Streptomyces sp. 2A115]|uniref:hypothetical protein n=1 Tax=Streptomyces sp. 2A115 TaxID=3457439 RepID=UPI003FCF36C3